MEFQWNYFTKSEIHFCWYDPTNGAIKTCDAQEWESERERSFACISLKWLIWMIFGGFFFAAHHGQRSDKIIKPLAESIIIFHHYRRCRNIKKKKTIDLNKWYIQKNEHRSFRMGWRGEEMKKLKKRAKIQSHLIRSTRLGWHKPIDRTSSVNLLLFRLLFSAVLICYYSYQIPQKSRAKLSGCKWRHQKW